MHVASLITRTPHFEEPWPVFSARQQLRFSLLPRRAAWERSFAVNGRPGHRRAAAAAVFVYSLRRSGSRSAITSPLFAMLPRSHTKPATNNREITTTQNTHVQIIHFCRTQPVPACRKFRSGLLSRKTADSNRTPLDLKINAAIVRNRWVFSPTVALFTLRFFGI